MEKQPKDKVLGQDLLVEEELGTVDTFFFFLNSGHFPRKSAKFSLNFWRVKVH